jgi:hypothetical protein
MGSGLRGKGFAPGGQDAELIQEKKGEAKMDEQTERNKMYELIRQACGAAGAEAAEKIWFITGGIEAYLKNTRQDISATGRLLIAALGAVGVTALADRGGETSSRRGK